MRVQPFFAGFADHAVASQAKLFDIYKPKVPTADIGEQQRSLAVRLELLDDDATLTDERIDAAMQAVFSALQSQLGARQRA